MKRCPQCKREWPADLEHFYRNAGQRDGLSAYCRPCHRAYAKRYLSDPERRAAQVEASRRNHLRRKYGITLEEWDALLAKQGGGCAVCGAPHDPNGGRLHVDHCHDTGRVRGLLCMVCNRLVGAAKDDPERLEKAAAYLR